MRKIPVEEAPDLDSSERVHDHPDFSQVAAAQRAALQGTLREWVTDFLEREGANESLANDIRSRRRRLRGPEIVNLQTLTRICGPEPELPWYEDRIIFDNTVDQFTEKILSGVMPAPLLIGRGVRNRYISDGNHTVEALKKCDYSHYWIVSWRAPRKW